MNALLDHCGRELTHEGPFDNRLDDLVRELDRSFGAHLEFEEQALAPVLAVVDHWGPERIRALQEDHARQRKQFATLLEGLDGERTESLAHAVSRLVTDSVRDMDDEEQGCLSSTLLADGFLEIERR